MAYSKNVLEQVGGRKVSQNERKQNATAAAVLCFENALILNSGNCVVIITAAFQLDILCLIKAVCSKST
jgi:hypothetical protein